MKRKREKKTEKPHVFEESIKNELKKRIDDFLTTIRSQNGTFENIFRRGKTNDLLKERGTNIGAFRKKISRTHEGKGLLTDPVLLTAILEDTGYPVQELFSDEKTPSLNMNLVLGPGTVNSLEKIIYKAVQDAQTPITRIAKIEKRLEAAKIIYKCVSIQIFSKDYSMAIFFLFFNFSKNNKQFYKHLDNKQLEHIDNLLEHIVNNLNNTFEIRNNMGKLLSLCYIIFEITRICKSFIVYGDKKENKTLSSKAKYEGFLFPNNYSKNDLDKNINAINFCLKDLISLAIKNNNIVFSDCNVIIYSNCLLSKLLNIDIVIPNLSEYYSLENMKKYFLFSPDKMQRKEILRKRYICEIDDDFISFIDNINKCLTLLLKYNNEPIVNDKKNKRESIWSKLDGTNLSDEVDDTKDNDTDLEKDHSNFKKYNIPNSNDDIEGDFVATCDEVDDTIDDDKE